MKTPIVSFLALSILAMPSCSDAVASPAPKPQVSSSQAVAKSKWTPAPTSRPTSRPAARVKIAKPTAKPTPKPVVLPRAEDVLPRGEVSKGSLVVQAVDYRFQIRPQMKPFQHADGFTGYRGTVKGIVGPAAITMFVRREKFDGDLAQLVAREVAAASRDGGKVAINRPVKIQIAGRLAAAHRFKWKTEQTLGVRVMAVRDGVAYVLHVETPNENHAFANVGSDLMIRGCTLHVAPPK